MKPLLRCTVEYESDRIANYSQGSWFFHLDHDNFIINIRVKQVDTAKDGGELKYIHVNHEDDWEKFVIVERLNIELPIVILMSEKHRPSPPQELKTMDIESVNHFGFFKEPEIEPFW